MYNLQFTKPAEQDLVDSLHYISDVLKTPIAAKNLLSDIEQQLKVLETLPISCPLDHDEYLARKGIRLLMVNNYLIFYVFKESEEIVSIIRLLYARRDWINILKDNSKEK
jgi:toxin ParE1/3/4